MKADRFRPVLYLQILLLFTDAIINSFGDLFRISNLTQLVLYVIQDVCIVCNIIIIFLMFFSTYIFQAGLVGILLARFRLTLVTSFLYLALCIALHVWSLRLRWNEPYRYVWSTGFHVLFGIQRSCATLYYYFYKRTALRVVDPRFYQNGAWLRQEIARHN